MSKIDLKVKVDKNSFEVLQDECFKDGIFWDSSGEFKRDYDKETFCLYYRAKSNTIQYGKHKYNFDLDYAKEVSVDEFLQKIQ